MEPSDKLTSRSGVVINTYVPPPCPHSRQLMTAVALQAMRKPLVIGGGTGDDLGANLLNIKDRVIAEGKESVWPGRAYHDLVLSSLRDTDVIPTHWDPTDHPMPVCSNRNKVHVNKELRKRKRKLKKLNAKRS